MQTKDFKGQDLRGRSFKNQDLTGADFSDCDLRGVDFSFANLTDAKFCNARMGRTLSMDCAIQSLGVLLAAIALSIVFMGNILLANAIKQILINLAIYHDLRLNLFMITYTLIFINVILVSINHKNFGYLYWFFCLISILSISIDNGTIFFCTVLLVAALSGIASLGI